MWTFDLWHLDLVGNNIPVLHSLSPKWIQKIYAKESLNVNNVKILSIFVSNVFVLFMPFFLKVKACTWHIEWFPWHQEPKRPQWPQQPQWPRWPQWPQQPHFIKKLTEHDAAINLAIELPILVSQCGMDYQKPTIVWSFGTFSVGGCGGHGCNFQPNPRVIS